MKITVLVDNLGNKENSELISEWGLAFYIEYEGKKILLDTGASGAFAENAKLMGIDLSAVDFAALSHAHFDHADGMDVFFSENAVAPMYISSAADENCYSVEPDEENPGEFTIEYDGIRKGWLKEFEDRYIRVNGPRYDICGGVSLVAHNTPGLESFGRKYNQYVLVDGEYVPDNYPHEQSLVFETDKGLVVFNSCSHGGVVNIIHEAEACYPDRNVYAMIGGFHQFAEPEEDVRKLADRIGDTGVKLVITGHCTGEEPFCWIEDQLEGRAEVVQMNTGLAIEI